MVGKYGSHDTKCEWEKWSGVNLAPYPPSCVAMIFYVWLNTEVICWNNWVMRWYDPTLRRNQEEKKRLQGQC